MKGITRENYIQIPTQTYASPRLGDALLVTISIIHLILSPQQTWTPKNDKLGPKPLLFILVAWW